MLPAVGGAVLMCCAAMAAQAQAPQVTIEVSTQADGSLQIGYSAPAGVDELSFVDASVRTHRLFREPMLRPLDDCATVNPTAIRRSRPDCTTLRFGVAPRRIGASAFYEPAQPASNGVLLFTRHYAVTVPGAALTWQFRAAAGHEVVFAGQGSDERRVHIGADAVSAANADSDQSRRRERLFADHYVFIGSADTRSYPGFIALRDTRVPRWLAARVEKTAGLLLDTLTQAFDVPPTGRVALFMLADGVHPQSGSQLSVHGDLSRGPAIRLHFVSPAPAVDADHQLKADEFIAHELVHLWNGDRFRSDLSRPWLHEGGADWLSAAALHDAGIAPGERLGQRLQSAFELCLVTHANEVWSRLDGSHGYDRAYACGMVLHALLYAVVRQHDPTIDPLAASAALYRQSAPLDEAGFARFAVRGTPAGHALHRALRDADAVFGTSVVQMLGALGVPYRHVPLAEVKSVAPRVRAALVRAIGNADCTRFAGFWTRESYVEFDPDNECRTLPVSARLIAAADVSLMHEPGRAVAAIAAHCKAALRVPVDLHDGGRVELPCPRLTMPLELPQVDGVDFVAALRPSK